MLHSLAVIPSVAFEDGRWVARADLRPDRAVVLSESAPTKAAAIDKLMAAVERFTLPENLWTHQPPRS